MPITIITAEHGAQSLPRSQPPGPETQQSFFGLQDQNILASNFDNENEIHVPRPASYTTVIEAYSKHCDLIIRPDDIWLTILSQLSYHINANAEDFRDKFVAHKGQKTLRVVARAYTIETIDWDEVSDKMAKVVDKELVDKTLTEWILPYFSTTERADRTCAAMFLFTCMKKYFKFEFHTRCGIPNVTLEGTKEDWVDIQLRLQNLDSWNDTTRAWKVLLDPIITRFIAAFDGNQDQDFWAHIASPEFQGSGQHTLGGWVTAFCVFEQDGKFNGNRHVKNTWAKEKRYVLDGVVYPIIGEEDIPRERAEVDVDLIDQEGEAHPAVLVVGNLGMKVKRREGLDGDAVQNVPMWCCYLQDKPTVRKASQDQIRPKEYLPVKSSSDYRW